MPLSRASSRATSSVQSSGSQKNPSVSNQIWRPATVRSSRVRIGSAITAGASAPTGRHSAGSRPAPTRGASAAAPDAASAALTRSGVAGSSKTIAPQASRIAFTIAGAVDTIAISPMPTEPSVPSSRGVSTTIVSMSMAWRMFGNLKVTIVLRLAGDVLLAQREPGAHVHPALELALHVQGVDDPPRVGRGRQADDLDLAGGGVDLDLGHLDGEDLDLERRPLAGHRVERCGLERGPPADVADAGGRPRRTPRAVRGALLVHRRAELLGRVHRGAARSCT